ncbi:DUF2345 domain-containing protein, partial [uncultured Gilliamella sp.]|uniref:DUF2345 domain-containing protein n=1 Tax=uncultured Gilliamella sp. TaxID=1193505 RepID=UPI0025EBD7D0
VSITASENITLICGGSYIKINESGIELGTSANVYFKSNALQKMGPASLFAPTIELPLGAITLSQLPCQLNLKISDIPGRNGINYANSDWRIVLANCSDDALMTDEVISEGKTTPQGELAISPDDSKELIKQYNKHPGFLWIVTNNIAYQLQFTTLGNEDSLKKNIKAAHAMGYNTKMLKEQKRFLNAVESNSQINKNQLINSIKK